MKKVLLGLLVVGSLAACQTSVSGNLKNPDSIYIRTNITDQAIRPTDYGYRGGYYRDDYYASRALDREIDRIARGYYRGW